MSKGRLTVEQIELLHHVELAQAGWQDRLADQLVVSAALAATVPLSAEAITEHMRVIVELSNSSEVTKRSIQRLVSARRLVEVQKGAYAPSEVTRREVGELRAKAAEIEGGARALFESIAAEEEPAFQPPSKWNWFCETCLFPLVRTLGARTYELLSTGGTGENAAKELIGFLDAVPGQQKQGVRRAVERFFASTDQCVRQFVLRQLHGYLLSLAASLPSGSLDSLQSGKGGPVQLNLFLDTNFLFSVLGLHENPANQAAGDLMALLDSIKSRVHATLYVIPLTVDEVRRTLTYHERRLAQINVTPRLSELASSVGGEFSGITQKYLSAVQAAKRRISAKDFLGPYLENLVTILRARGIELYNADVDALSTEQPVIDDILEQEAVEKKRGDKAKGYEALRHDVTLWHLVAGRRPKRLDAPLDAVYWIATVDFRFMGFDSYKRRGQVHSVPVCVHPAVFVQMLQLWLPRNPAFEAALFESLRASLPHSFDSDSEDMSLRILRALSRFEDVDDLPVDTVTSILINKALRARMRIEPDLDEQIVLVRDVIIADAAAIRDALETEKAKAVALTTELEQLKAEKGKVEVRAGTVLGEADQRRIAIETDLEKERGASKLLADRLTSLEAALASEQRQRQEDRDGVSQENSRRQFVVLGALLFCVLGTAAWFGAWLLPAWLSQSQARFLTCAVAMALWSGTAIILGRRLEHVKTWPEFARVELLMKWLLGSAGAVIFSLIAQALWVWFSSGP